MTVVQPNSIAGINSISVQSGNALNLHKSDGTLIRTLVAESGISTYSSISVGSATTDNNADKSINIGLGASIAQHDANTLTFGTNGDPRATIDASGHFVHGGGSSRIAPGGTARLVQVEALTAAAGFSAARNSADSLGPYISLAKSRGTALGAVTVVQSGDHLGTIKFGGADGTDLASPAVEILAEVDGTPGSNDMPGRLLFKTTADGANSATERLRITNDGKILVGGHSSGSVVSAGGLECLNGSGNNFGAGRFVAGAGGPDFWFLKSRHATAGSHTVVQSGDTTGTIQFAGSDGDSWTRTAAIVSLVDGTPGDADMPGRLSFQTTADGASSPTERLRIDKEGSVSLMTANAMLKWTASSGNDPFVRSIGSGQQSLEFNTGGSERLRITSGGHIIAGGQGSAIAFNNVGNDSFGSVIEIDGSHTTDHHGMLSVVGKTDTDTYVAGRVQFINSQNSSGSSGSDAGSKNIAAIEGRITTSDSNAGDDSGGYLRFVTKAEAGGNAEAMRITSDGKIGIGDASPAALLSLKASNPTIRFTDSSTLVGSIEGDTAANVYYGFNGADIVFSVHSATSYAPRLRINDTGRVLIGGQSDNSSAGGFENMLQIEGTSASSSSISIIRNSNDNNPPYINFGKSRGTSVNSNTAVVDNDLLGQIDWTGSDGSGAFNNYAGIKAYVDGTPGNSDAPGRLTFWTSPDGSNSPAERLRIDSSGNVGVNTDFTGSQAWRSGKKIEIFGGGGNVTGELHIGANRGDGQQSVGSINFFDNTQDSTHRHVAVIEVDKTGSTSNKRGGDLLFYTKTDNVAAPTAKMRITSDGSVGILQGGVTATSGTGDVTWPYSPLHVKYYSNTSSSTTGTYGQYIENYVGSDLGQQKTWIGMAFHDDNENNRPQVKFGAELGQRSDANTVALEGSGNFVVYTATGNSNYDDNATEKFVVKWNGDASLTGSLSEGSDARLKDNVATISGALNKVKQLRGIQYTWNSTAINNVGLSTFVGTQLGVIADEVESVVPEVVINNGIKGVDETFYKAVSYDRLVPLLIESIKELTAKVEALESS